LEKIVIKTQSISFNSEIVSLMQVLFPECEVEVVFEETAALGIQQDDAHAKQSQKELNHGEYPAR
jgi:hypothetical protein